MHAPLSQPDSLETSRRKIEDLPDDGGHVVDTLAGAILRIFVRINHLEAEIARLKRRPAPDEQQPMPPACSDTRPAGSTAGAQGNTQIAESAAPALLATDDGLPAVPAFLAGDAPRRRGRPKGAKDSQPRTRRRRDDVPPLPNGHDADVGDHG